MRSRRLFSAILIALSAVIAGDKKTSVLTFLVKYVKIIIPLVIRTTLNFHSPEKLSPVLICHSMPLAMIVCMYICIFIKLHITAQSGPVILITKTSD